MKKILILSSLFSGEVILNFDEFKKLIKSEFCYFSPLSLVNDTTTKEFAEKFLAASMSLSREFLNIYKMTENSRPDAKALIYFGPATKEAKFDIIYVVDYNKLNTQESFLQFILGKELSNKFYRSDEAIERFNTIKEVLEFIEQNV